MKYTNFKKEDIFLQENNRYNSTMKRADAPTITYSLIEWLDNRYDNKTITTEISVNTTFGTKIADVVVSNGHSIAYEVKSAFDTTKRLNAQVNGFSEMFEYVYLVYWDGKYNLKGLNLPSNIGLIKAYWKDDKVCFSIVQNARINRLATSFNIAPFLWKKELRYFLGLKQQKFKMSDDKDTLVELFSKNYGKRDSVRIFRYVLKNRFELGFSVFQKLKDLKAFRSNKSDINYPLQYS